MYMHQITLLFNYFRVITKFSISGGFLFLATVETDIFISLTAIFHGCSWTVFGMASYCFVAGFEL